MKRSLFIVPLFFLAGCGLSPQKIETIPLKEPVQRESPSQDQKTSPTPVSVPIQAGNDVLVTTESLDSQEKLVELYTYQLPIANSDITTREVSGFLNEEKSGKISKTEIGMGEVEEEYYFNKGELIFVRTTTKFTVDGTADVKIIELTFKNGKLIKTIKNSEAVTDNTINSFLEEQGKTDATRILEDFSMKKELNG